MIADDYKLTQAYWAGYLFAELRLHTKLVDKIHILEAIRYCHSYQELFGFKIWHKVKTYRKLQRSIRHYEALAWRAGLPGKIGGCIEDFVLGYAERLKKYKTRSNTKRSKGNTFGSVLNDYESAAAQHCLEQGPSFRPIARVNSHLQTQPSVSHKLCVDTPAAAVL